jgi:flagellar assembly protein FliH
LYKIVKNESLCRHDKTNLYCFPDISVDGCKDAEDLPGGVTQGTDGFQRIVLGEDCPNGYRPFIDRHGSGEKSKRDLEIDKESPERQAYLQGFAQGEKAGIEQGKKQIDPVLNNFKQALSELDNVKKQILLNAEKEAVELALAVAKKIVHHEIAINKEIVRSTIQKALKKVVDHEDIIIRLNPSDLELLEQTKDRVSDLTSRMDSVTFEADGNVQSGGCIIETGLGEIDARIEKQLQAVEEAFKVELQHPR